MYGDFSFLNFFKTTHKLQKIKRILGRLWGDYNQKLRIINNLELKISGLEEIINILEKKKDEVLAEDLAILPDLIITSIYKTEYSHYTDFKITVKNIGASASSSCSLGLTVNGYSTTMTIPSLSPDESINLYFQYPYDPSGDPQTYTLTAIADNLSEVEESNENNNRYITTFEGKTPYEPPEGYGGVIVHCHNPEGKEINSINGLPSGERVEIWKSGVFWYYGVSGAGDHSKPLYYIPPGTYSLQAKFNGMTLQQNMNVIEGQTTIVVFTFERTRTDIKSLIDTHYADEIEHSWSYTTTSPLDIITPFINYESRDIIRWTVGTYKMWGSLSFRFNSEGFYFYGVWNEQGTGNGDTLFHYLNSTYVYPSYYEKTINIPAQTEFNKWYCQRNITTTTNWFPLPTLYIKKGLTSVTILKQSYSETYQDLFSFDATTDYDKISLLVSVYTWDLSGQIRQSESNIDFLEMASVPYDMLGTAI